MNCRRNFLRRGDAALAVVRKCACEVRKRVDPRRADCKKVISVDIIQQIDTLGTAVAAMLTGTVGPEQKA